MKKALLILLVFLTASSLGFAQKKLSEEEKVQPTSLIVIRHDGSFDKRDEDQLVGFMRSLAYVRYKIVKSEDGNDQKTKIQPFLTFNYSRSQTGKSTDPVFSKDEQMISVSFVGSPKVGQGEDIIKECERLSMLALAQKVALKTCPNILCVLTDIKENPQARHVRDYCPPCYVSARKSLQKSGLTFSRTPLKIER